MGDSTHAKVHNHCHSSTTWPELWGLWMIEDYGWVISSEGPCDGPQVYWTREEASRAAKDVAEFYDIPCEPKQVYTTGARDGE